VKAGCLSDARGTFGPARIVAGRRGERRILQPRAGVEFRKGCVRLMLRQIGDTDLDVFPLCLGCNVFGWTVGRDDAFKVLDAYLAAGGNFFDTADVDWKFKEGNKGGESETIIGEWMRRRRCHDRMVVSTKIGALDGPAGGLTAANIRAKTEDSMRRLGVDVIDRLYAHIDDAETPLEETLSGFDALVREGKVRYIAASRYDAKRLGGALEISRNNGLVGYSATQCLYSLVEREYEGTLRPLVEESRIGMMAYYALAAGFLTGKYRLGGHTDSVRASGPRPGGARSYLDTRGMRLLAALDEISSEHGVTVAAVSLAWLLAKPTVTAPIASARTVGQLNGLLPATRIALTHDDIRRLDDPSAE
jgi:aryl-alcohol dehydrogenase-like predicted oxidoreductase